MAENELPSPMNVVRGVGGLNRFLGWPLSRWPTRPLLMGPAPLSPPAVGVVFTVINRAVWRFAEGRRSPQTRQKRPHRRPVTATPPCDTPLSDRASGAVQSLPSPAGGGGAQRLREAGPLARRGELPFVVVARRCGGRRIVPLLFPSHVASPPRRRRASCLGRQPHAAGPGAASAGASAGRPGRTPLGGRWGGGVGWSTSCPPPLPPARSVA